MAENELNSICGISDDELTKRFIRNKKISQTSHMKNSRGALQNIGETATKYLRPNILGLSDNKGGVSCRNHQRACPVWSP